ncbi:MAG: GntR family transcriptional regulator [Fibrobacteraceae bacterium]|nr:GntR family transcriptional regulator [Fibrobacteraceae bacterium]
MIKDQIISSLINQAHQAGDKLPSVRSLMKVFDAASATVQSALSSLVKQKLIYSVKCKGYFWGSNELTNIEFESSRASEALKKRFYEDFQSGYFQPDKDLPTQKELCVRYHVSYGTLSCFLKKELALGSIERVGRRYFLATKKERSSSEILLITRADSLGLFVPASEREMEFIRLVYQSAAAQKLKLRLLGYDTKNNCFVDRKGERRELEEFPKVVGYLVSTLLIFDPVQLLYKISDGVKNRNPAVSIPVSIWWEHPAENLPRVFFKHKNWAFYNATFGKNPGIVVGKYLQNMGHKNAVYISPFHNSSWSRDRLRGLNESGLSVQPLVLDKFASPWDIREECRKNGPKQTLEFRSRQMLSDLVRGLMESGASVLENTDSYTKVVVCVNDEVAGVVKELLEERDSSNYYVIAYDNSMESYLLQLDSFDFNTPTLVEQMYYHLANPQSQQYLQNQLRDVFGKIVEK